MLKRLVAKTWAEVFKRLKTRSDLCIVTTNTEWGGSEAVWLSVYQDLKKSNKNVIIFAPPPLIQKIYERKLIPLEETKLFPYYPDRKILNTIKTFLRLSIHKPKLAYISQQYSMDAYFWMENFKLLPTPYINFIPLCLVSVWPSDEVLLRMLTLFNKSKLLMFDSTTNMAFFDILFGFKFENKLAVSHALPSIQYKQKTVSDEEVTLGIMARFECHHKAFDLLLESLSGLKNSKWKLLIAGHGPHQELISRIVALYGLQSRVQIETNMNLKEFYSKTDVLLFPSRFEGTPLLLISALTANKVCVVNNCGGMGEIITNGQDGFVSKNISAEGFRSALTECLQNRTKWAEIQNNCPKALQRYSQLPEIVSKVKEVVQNDNR